MGIRVEKQSTKYLISDTEFEIQVEVMAEDGELIINTHNGGKKFLFEHSEPDTVEAIAKLMLEAAKLGQEAIKEQEADNE